MWNNTSLMCPTNRRRSGSTPECSSGGRAVGYGLDSRGHSHPHGSTPWRTACRPRAGGLFDIQGGNQALYYPVASTTRHASRRDSRYSALRRARHQPYPSVRAMSNAAWVTGVFCIPHSSCSRVAIRVRAICIASSVLSCNSPCPKDILSVASTRDGEGPRPSDRRWCGLGVCHVRAGIHSATTWGGQTYWR